MDDVEGSRDVTLNKGLTIHFKKQIEEPYSAFRDLRDVLSVSRLLDQSLQFRQSRSGRHPRRSTLRLRRRLQHQHR